MKKWSLLTALVFILAFFAHQAQAQQSSCRKAATIYAKAGETNAVSQLAVWGGSSAVAKTEVQRCQPSNCKPSDCCVLNCRPGQCPPGPSDKKNIKLVNAEQANLSKVTKVSQPAALAEKH